MSDVEQTAQAAEPEYKRQQRIAREKLRTVMYLQPTLPERINRLNPQERHEIKRLIGSMKLRKIIRRTLAEAFWSRDQSTSMSDSMQKLRATVKAHESLQSYERALTGSDSALTFEPVITTSQQPTIIEVPK